MTHQQHIRAPETKTTVLLVDDHSLIGDLIKKYLPIEGAFDVTVATSLDTGIAEILTRGAFDVVLLDVLLPERLTHAQIEKIVNANSDGNVVLFSGGVSEEFFHKTMNSGARGLIPKTLPLKSLASAINLVATGEPFVQAGYFSRHSANSLPNEFNLTPSETEVLHKLALGQSNKDIMRNLDLTESTVKMRVRSLAKKLGARNRTHAVIIARQYGLV